MKEESEKFYGEALEKLFCKENKQMNTKEFKNGDIVLKADIPYIFIGYHPDTKEWCIVMTHNDSQNLYHIRTDDIKHKPKIITKEFWVNIYPDQVGRSFNTEEDAKHQAMKDCIRQQKFTYEIEE